MLRITDIQNNRVDWPSVPGCQIESDEAEKYLLSANDILIARTGGTIGKSFIVPDAPVKSVFASYLIRVTPPQSMAARYLKTSLESPLYWSQLRQMSAGTGQPNVNGQALGRLEIPLPPLAEQKRIVAKVDELMALCDRLFGVRTTATNTGRSPGWDDPHFVDRCRKALERQIDALDPRAIICLGIQAPRLLAGIFPECGVWTGTTFTKIDVARKAVIEIGSPARTVQMGTVLVHPSFRHANVWRRRYKGHEGDAAEVEMLKDVWKEVRSLP